MKYYIKPITEKVVVRLENSMLGDPGIADWSKGAGELGGKQDDFSLDDDSFTPDLWGDEEEEDF